jgi:hypothetical protein
MSALALFGFVPLLGLQLFLPLLGLLALYWIIRLAVRHGMDDAWQRTGCAHRRADTLVAWATDQIAGHAVRRCDAWVARCGC